MRYRRRSFVHLRRSLVPSRCASRPLSVFNNEVQAELYSQLSPEDKELIKKADHWRANEAGYDLLQSSKFFLIFSPIFYFPIIFLPN